MPFFMGVSTDASAYPLNATDIATQINNLFANPNGMVSLLDCCAPCCMQRMLLAARPSLPSHRACCGCQPAVSILTIPLVATSSGNLCKNLLHSIAYISAACLQTGSLPNASFSADDITTMTSALTSNIQAAIDGGTNYPWPS